MLDPIRSALFGVAVGDALDVPHEFQALDLPRYSPIRAMDGNGTHTNEQVEIGRVVSRIMFGRGTDLDICRHAGGGYTVADEVAVWITTGS